MFSNIPGIMRRSPFPTLVAIGFAFSGTAFASGLELMPGGARSVGRGGATAARPEDPMAVAQNPAGLAFLTGHQAYVDLDLPVHRMCFEPYGYYGWGVYRSGSSEFGDQLGDAYAKTPLPKVCNSAPTLPLPQLGWAGKITERFAMGAGFFAPVVVPGMQFGGEDGTIETPQGARPTPTRYTLVKQQVTDALAPTVAAAYRVIDQLSVGLTLQVLMVRAEATQVQNNFSGTQPSTDWLAKLTTQDFFVPALTFAVHARPIEALNLMAAFKWSDDVRGSGDVVFESNTFHRGSTTGPVPYRNDPIRLADVTVRFPWQLTGGARFSGKLKSPGLLGDPMDTELWDIEADIAYSMNKRASSSSVRLGQEEVAVETHNADGTFGSTPVKGSDIGGQNIDRHLKDSIAVRVGGSLNVLPRRLAVNLGGFYETRGVEPAYADISTFAFQRVGIGTGIVLRFGNLDLIAGYAHIFSETLDLAPPPHQNAENAVVGDPRSGFDKRVGGTFNASGQEGVRQGGTVLEDPRAPAPGKADAVAAGTQKSALAQPYPERVVNAGKYTAAFDILSVGVAWHF